MKYKELSANSVAFISCRHRQLCLQLKRATVLAEISLYFIFSPVFLHYIGKSSRYHTLRFCLTFLIISRFQVFILYYYVTMSCNFSVRIEGCGLPLQHRIMIYHFVSRCSFINRTLIIEFCITG